MPFASGEGFSGVFVSGTVSVVHIALCGTRVLMFPWEIIRYLDRGGGRSLER